MKRTKKWWMVLLLGALLMATVVGVAGARPKAGPSYKLTIPAAHFHPRSDDYDYWNSGSSITLNSGGGIFYAALPIALPGRFTVEKFTLFAYDNHATSNIEAWLYRMNPWTGSSDAMALVSTTDQSGAIQVRSNTSIHPDTIYGGHGGWVYVMIPYDTNLDAYAVQIEYH